MREQIKTGNGFRKNLTNSILSQDLNWWGKPIDSNWKDVTYEIEANLFKIEVVVEKNEVEHRDNWVFTILLTVGFFRILKQATKWINCKSNLNRFLWFCFQMEVAETKRNQLVRENDIR